MANNTIGGKVLTRSQFGETFELFARSFSAHSLLIALTLVSFSAYVLLIPAMPNQDPLNFTIIAATSFFGMILCVIAGMFLLSFYDVLVHQKPKSATVALIKTFWNYTTDRRRAALGIPFIFLFNLYLISYVEIKNHISVTNPYSWDQLFYEWDKILHFGVSPWEWVHPFFSSNPYLVLALSINYHFWFITMWLIMIPFAFSSGNTQLRTQYFLAFFLTWSVGGSLLATVFSSAGPAFYSGLGLSPDPYAPLMTYLHELNQTLPIWAIDIQDRMWREYSNQGLNLGISAMPSMHNATALLFVIGGWHLNKKGSILLAAHAFLIYIGSFYLGWHYAMDAYLGWIVAISAWFISAPIARWWHGRPEVIAFDDCLERVNARYHASVR